MNKIFIFIFIFSTMLFSYDIKSSDISFSWTGFKTLKKIGVSGIFEDVEYSLNKKNNQSLTQSLKGIKVYIKTSSLNIGGNKVKYNNVYNHFFKLMNSKKIEASIYKVIEGDKLGTLTLKIKMNGRVNIVPMQYNIKNDTLKATGVLDVLDFALSKQYKSLAKACKPFHKDLTWTQVELKLNIKL
jgi:hypothetical protein